MSIAGIQRRRLFEEVTRTFYSSGEKPRLADILAEVSRYFAKYPAGKALKPVPGFIVDNRPAQVGLINQAFLGVQHNLSVGYEASLEQVRDIMALTSILNSHVERLRTRRNRLISSIDDHLFALFNSDGYYMSLSDTFDDLNHTDLTLTSAFVDTSLGKVSLPTTSSLTNQVPANLIGSDPAIAILADGKSATWRTLSPFSNALDGLSNTIWAIEVETKFPVEVLINVGVNLNGLNKVFDVSRIEFEPWGIQPVQLMVKTQKSATSGGANTGYMEKTMIPEDFPKDVFGTLGFVGDDFDNRIITSSNKIVLTDSMRRIVRANFFLRKKTPDYSLRTAAGTTIYRYIFGAKNISFTEHIYDQEAIFVSSPLSLPTDLVNDHVIDAVSIIAQGSAPTETSLTYWVAADLDSDNPEIGDFEWKKISPLERENRAADSVVKFNGAATHVINIKADPGIGDTQLIAARSGGGAPDNELNPSPHIIPGVDVWRLAEFSSDVLPSSTLLEEGINTVRILYTDSTATSENNLEFWAPYVNGTNLEASEIYNRIDSGVGFFNGGVIGEGGQYAYVETYLEREAASEIFIRNLRKLDPNSKLWDVKTYLNGREIGNLSAGTDFLAIPWKFNEGINHIILLITIPEADADAPLIYDGRINLMEEANLFDFGTVKLKTWSFVDFFHMQYNETGQPFTFTIRDTGDNKKEIISRRKPTDNFRFKYARSTSKGPDAVRLKVDLKRSAENPSVTPSLDLYRLRFLYT